MSAVMVAVGTVERDPAIYQERYECRTCHGDAFLAASGLAQIKSGEASEVACLKCAMAEQTGNTAIQIPTVEQIMSDLGCPRELARLMHDVGIRELLRQGKRVVEKAE